MTKCTLSVGAAFLGVTVCTACADRLTAPQAVELVATAEESLAPGGNPQRWLGGLFKSDLRLRAKSAIPLRLGGEPLTYQTIVLERVVVPSNHGVGSSCGVRRAAYLWRGDGDGIVFFPGGSFDERLVPLQGICLGESDDQPRLRVTVITPDGQRWLPESVQGDISPGVVTGECAFLEPEAERFLREEHGVTCQLTRHRVTFDAELRTFVGVLDTMRLHLDSTEMVGVRYTINCNTAKNQAWGPCRRPDDSERHNRTSRGPP